MRKYIALILTLLLVTSGFVLAGGQSEDAGTGQTSDEPMAVAMGEYNEAPMLAEMVAAGELPPVDERLPENPLVVEPPVEIGEYGGVMKLMNTRDVEWADFGSGRGTAIGWLKLDWNGNPYGELVERWELSDDMTTWTFHFREGVKWSDGEPLTTDDIMFAINDVQLHPDYNPGGYRFLQAGDEYAEITQIDDYTIEMEFAVPHPAFMSVLTGFRTWQGHMTMPKHYLSKWHPDYNDEAEALAEEEGFDSWVSAFQWHNNIYSGQNDLDMPRLDPFVPVQMEPTRMVFERNPYFFKVDPEGNQLPYVDGLDYDVVSNIEVATLNVINGDYDYACERLQFKDYPILKEKDENDPTWPFDVSWVPNGISTQVVFHFPQGFNADPAIAELTTDQRFREAFAMAIDRDAINEVQYFGLGRPNSAVPVNEGAAFYEPEWEDYMNSFDPDRSAELLAELGLTEKNRDGILIMEDGRPLNLVVETNVNNDRVFELIEGQLADVGIGMDFKFYADFPQLVERAGLHTEIMVHSNDGYGNQDIRAWQGIGNIFSWTGTGWGEWFTTGGAEGIEPPQNIKDLKVKYDQWQATLIGTPEYNRLGAEIVEEYLHNTYAIGIVGYTPHPVVKRDTVGNIIPPPTAWGFARDTMSRWRETVFLRQE